MIRFEEHPVQSGDRIEMVDLPQVFECVGFIDYQPGKRLSVWWAPCATCGRPFTQTMPSTGEWKPNRRCVAHHQPGRPVKRRNGNELCGK